MTSDLNHISGAIINHALKIHQTIGPGLLESVYHRILAFELRKARFRVQAEVLIPIEWDGHIIDESFKADLIVNNSVLVELKSLETLQPVHKKQTLTYLKLAKLNLGLLINFGSTLLKDGIHRIANNLPEQ